MYPQILLRRRFFYGESGQEFTCHAYVTYNGKINFRNPERLQMNPARSWQVSRPIRIG